MRQELEPSAAVTPTGSFPVTSKNAFRSKATARSVFGRHRPATNSRYRSADEEVVGFAKLSLTAPTAAGHAMTAVKRAWPDAASRVP
jgi:hypothetical protein